MPSPDEAEVAVLVHTAARPRRHGLDLAIAHADQSAGVARVIVVVTRASSNWAKLPLVLSVGRVGVEHRHQPAQRRVDVERHALRRRATNAVRRVVSVLPAPP